MELSEHRRVAIAIIIELVVAMWRGDDVRSAILHGNLAHLRGHFPRLGAVIDAGQNVAVNVNHIERTLRTNADSHGWLLNRVRVFLVIFSSSLYLYRSRMNSVIASYAALSTGSCGRNTIRMWRVPDFSPKPDPCTTSTCFCWSRSLTKVRSSS